MRQSENQTTINREELDKALADFTAMYNIPDLVQKVGDLQLCTAEAPNLSKLDRQRLTYFIARSSKILACLMCLHDADGDKVVQKL